MKILYQILVVSLLPLLTVLSINYYQSKHIEEIHKNNTKNILTSLEKNLQLNFKKKLQTYEQFAKLISKSQPVIDAISIRDNNILFNTAKQYINSGLFSKIVFIDKEGYVIARGDAEYLFNDNIKTTQLKEIFNEKKEFKGIIEFDNTYNFIYMKPIYKFDIEFLGYLIIGETINDDFLDTLHAKDYYLKFTNTKNEYSIDNFIDTNSYVQKSFEKKQIKLKYKQLINNHGELSITIFKSHQIKNNILNNKNLTLSNIVILMLILLPILIWYLTKKILSPLNNLNTTLIKFKENKNSLNKTLHALKNIPSNNYEIKEIVTSVISTLEKLYVSQSNLIEQKEKTQKSDKYKSDFIENISSQIEQPLNSILTFGEILKKTLTESNKDQQNYLNDIIKNSHKLKAQFNDLIELSNLSFGSIKLNNTPVKISNIIKKTQNFFEIDIKNKNLTLEVYIDNFDEKNCIYIDEEKLQKVLTKLIENAIKYTMKGSIKIYYDIKNPDYKDNLLSFSIEIIDTGLGMNEDDYHRISNSIQNSHINYNKKNNSIGLNLSLVNKIVQLMNGKISLSSKLNKGTSFRLFFSDVKFSENLECDENKNNKILSSIIIAEKNEENKKNIQNYFNLNYPNIKIYETSDAYETIKYSYNSNHRISLIILGKKIQSMKINDILEYLRSNNHTNDIPIVVIKDSKNKIKEFKLTEFIDTPLNEKKLTKILKKLNTNL